MQVTYLDHVSMLVTNVDWSRRFDRGVLELREVPPLPASDFAVVGFDRTIHE